MTSSVLGARLRFFGFCLALAALLAGPALASAQTDDERAHTHFTAGRSYFEEGNYEQALAEFQHAYELSHRDVLLENVANCQERLGQWREAAQTLDTYLASLAPDADERGAMERRIQALRQRADQRDAEDAARLASARGVETTPPGDASAPPDTSHESTRSGASDGLLVPAIIAFGVGGAAAIAWGVLGGLALAEQSSVSSGCGATRSCTPSQVSTLSGLATGADVSMSIALVGIAAGVVMILIDPPHGPTAGADSSAQLRVLPWGSSSGAGLVVGGTL